MGRNKLKLVITAAEQEELRAALKTTTEVRLRDRIHAVQLATTGCHTHEEIASLIGRARSGIQQWINHYQAGGLARLLARKKPPGKASPIAGAEVQAQLRAGLLKGQWRTAGQMAAWLAATHGIKRAAQSMYYWLGKVGGTLQVPRPAHDKGDPAQRAEFREHLVEKLVGLDVPAGRRVKVWVADECRIGLHTFTRRCWGLRGHRVVVPRQHVYQWGYVYGAAEVTGTGVEFQLLPTVSLNLAAGFLAQIAASDPGAEHVVIWDNAGFHPVAGDEEVPSRVHLLPLPPYSPELNPVEGLWDQMKDVLCNRLFRTMEDLEAAVTEALRPFWKIPEKVESLVFEWMRVEVNAI